MTGSSELPPRRTIASPLVGIQLDESAEAYEEQLRKLLPGVPVGTVRGQGVTGLPGYEMELTGVLADVEPSGGWLRFVGPLDEGGTVEMTVFRARVHAPGLAAFAEALCPGPVISICHLERVRRISDGQKVLRGAAVLQQWAKGRTPGSGVIDQTTFVDCLNEVLRRLRGNRLRISQELVARNMDMDRGTFRDYLQRYNLNWAVLRVSQPKR